MNSKYPDGDNSTSFLIGSKNVVLMLFNEPTFKGFINKEISIKGTEVLLSFDAESKEEVDELVQGDIV